MAEVEIDDPKKAGPLGVTEVRRSILRVIFLGLLIPVLTGGFFIFADLTVIEMAGAGALSNGGALVAILISMPFLYWVLIVVLKYCRYIFDSAPYMIFRPEGLVLPHHGFRLPIPWRSVSLVRNYSEAANQNGVYLWINAAPERYGIETLLELVTFRNREKSYKKHGKYYLALPTANHGGWQAIRRLFDQYTQ